MKVSRTGLHFNYKNGGCNAFFRDIVRVDKNRNAIFFIKQAGKGIIKELMIK
jgi:hypothetical protein